MALTAGVWFAAISSAAALAYALNRPLQTREAPATFEEPLPVAAGEPATAKILPPVGGAGGDTLSIPTITIISKARTKHAPPKAEPEPLPDTSEPEALPDISKMNCADWRELDMGHGRVRVCE